MRAGWAGSVGTESQRVGSSLWFAPPLEVREEPPTALLGAPTAPPRSSRHVPPRRPISACSAWARDSNCGAWDSPGSALVAAVACGPMEHRIVGPKPYRATRLVSVRAGVWAKRAPGLVGRPLARQSSLLQS